MGKMLLNSSVTGVSEDSTDFFCRSLRCSHRSMSCCCRNHPKTMDGVNVGGHELPSSHHATVMERTSESCWGSEQTDCRRAGWTVDYHFGPSTSQRQKVGRVRDGPGGNPGFFVHERSGQHLILGGDFNASFHGLTDFHHAGESIPRPRTLTDTNDTLRARALHAVVAELDLTVDEHTDGRKLRTGMAHTKQLDSS